MQSQTSLIPRKIQKRGSVSKKDLIFYSVLMIWPVAHFCVFYLGVNFNSLLMVFQKIDVTSGTTYTLFGNLKTALDLMFHDAELVPAAAKSLIAYAVPLVIGTPLALLFSYYVYKKMPLGKMFRVMLFMPSIISSIVIVAIFKGVIDDVLPALAKLISGADRAPDGLLVNDATRWGTIVFYNIWVGFGVNVLMYVNAMNDIPPEQVEAAHLDGATGFKEFWYLSLPSVYSTITTFLVVGVAGIFTNQFNIFNFYGSEAPHGTITYGYWLYKETLAAANSPAQMPVIAAMGVCMTVVAVPLTLVVRKLLDKFGPSAE